jgi:hypothetical protein
MAKVMERRRQLKHLGLEIFFMHDLTESEGAARKELWVEAEGYRESIPDHRRRLWHFKWVDRLKGVLLGPGGRQEVF